MGRLYLIILRMVISLFPNTFQCKTNQIPPPDKVQGITYDQIKAVLQFMAQ